MKEAAVIIIGNEILLGRVTDTNSGFIARTLDPYGISVDTIVTVGDDGEAIADAVRRLTAVYPLVLPPEDSARQKMTSPRKFCATYTEAHSVKTMPY